MTRPVSPHSTNLSRRNLIAVVAAAGAAAMPIPATAATEDADTSPPATLEFLRDVQFEAVPECIGRRAAADFESRLEECCRRFRVGFRILGASKPSLIQDTETLNSVGEKADCVKAGRISQSMEIMLDGLSDACEFAASLVDLTRSAEIRWLSAALNVPDFHEAAAERLASLPGRWRP
jgi:hypothetical protein